MNYSSTFRILYRSSLCTFYIKDIYKLGLEENDNEVIKDCLEKIEKKGGILELKVV